jgi:hypothetical protein
VHFVNEHHKVMTENLTKRFVDHRNVRLAAKRVSELAFHRAKSAVNVAALVATLQNSRLRNMK